MCLAQKALISLSVTLPGSFKTTKALTRSPIYWSGTPITATSRAVHVVAALRLVGDNTALWALLAIFLDARCCGLLNDGVAARPIGAGLTNVRVAVGETVTEKRH